jgi:hypothetical protein
MMTLVPPAVSVDIVLGLAKGDTNVVAPTEAPGCRVSSMIERFTADS